MIEVQNLTKYYGDFKAVDDISFSIQKGEIVGILGPNGAGKSTTIRILCCYLDPTTGTIRVGNHAVQEEPREVKELIGYLAEAAPLYNDMMVLSYLNYILQMRDFPKAQINARVEEIAHTCGLENVMHKSINELSKGYKQRVGLAHALLGDPEILILDEPTSGLDPNQIVEIRNLIKKIGEHKTVLLSSHILSEVEATCDRVIIINKGKIVADEKTSELYNQAGGGRTVVVELASGNHDDLAKFFGNLSGVRSVLPMDSQTARTPLAYALHCEAGSDKREAIYRAVAERGLPLIGLYEKSENLEGIFRELTTSSEAT